MNQPDAKIAQLLQLGFIEDLPDFDYITELGFETNDIPDLLELISSNTVLKNDPKEVEYWAPLHAALAISQFQHPTTLAPLIESFDHLNELNLAEEILPVAVASFGSNAIAALEQRFKATNKSQFSQVIAMDSLVEISLHQPETRNQVLTIFKDYMAHPINDAADLNALLIAHLMEMEAVDCIDDIRALYNSSEVDIYCVGDIEDVEISLGLRKQRSSPRSIPSILAEDIANEYTGLDDDEDDYLGVLEYILLEYGNENAIHNISELDGYFAAIGCSPEPIQPSTWFPPIWGNSKDTPQFERKETAEVFSELAIQLYNESMEQLLQGEYHPMFGEVEGSDLMVVDEWCMGFMRGLGLWPATSTEDQANLEKYIAPIQYFCGENLEIFNRSNHKKTLKQQNSIAPNVIKIRRLMFKLSQGTFVHETAKIGRNDPCSCGSGKKYKKCCGLN